MEEQVTTEGFICEECGTTTPIANDTCAVCGGHLVPIDAMREPTDHELSAEDDEIPVGIDDSGSESLESLAEKELNEDQRSYNEDSYDDE